MLDVADAKEYLKGPILLPVRDANKQPRFYRVSRKLGLVLSHLIGSLKRHVLSVYFHKLNMNKEGLTPALATKWKNDNNCTDSELGTSAIGAAMNSLYRRAGINDMFVPASAVGSKAHVVGCMRVCSLVSLCVRSFMDEVESASEEGVPTFADKSLSRSSWAAELELTASFWPKSDAVHHEVRLIDGGDDGRAVLAFPAGDNPVSRLDGDMGAADDDAFDDMDGFESDS